MGNEKLRELYEEHRKFHRDMHNLMIGGMFGMFVGEAGTWILAADRKFMPLYVLVGALFTAYFYGYRQDRFYLRGDDY